MTELQNEFEQNGYSSWINSELYPSGKISTQKYTEWLEKELIEARIKLKNNVDLANVSQQRKLLIGFYNKRNNDLVKSDKPRTIEESANEFIKTNL